MTLTRAVKGVVGMGIGPIRVDSGVNSRRELVAVSTDYFSERSPWGEEK